MRDFIALLMIAVAAFTWNAARAFPDGAPWGTANPAAEQNCATCHFDTDPVRDSEALVISGLPLNPVPGAIYKLKIMLADPDTVTAGFQLIAQAENHEAGTFFSTEAEVEFIGAVVRSTAPLRSNARVLWEVEWRAPTAIVSLVVFYVAASAANDDGSPFGDKIHFRSYRLTVD